MAQLNDRIAGAEMGRVKLTPPVDEKISGLARRTAAIGVQIILANAGHHDGERRRIATQQPTTQPAQRFVLNDLMRTWNPDWTLERAGFGGDGVGAMPGIRGITHLEGDILGTYPRDEARGVVLRRQVKLGAAPALSVEVAAEPKKAWELNVYIGNTQINRQIGVGAEEGRTFQRLEFDLAEYAGREVTLRLYQRVLLPGTDKLPGNALWRNLVVR